MVLKCRKQSYLVAFDSTFTNQERYQLTYESLSYIRSMHIVTFFFRKGFSDFLYLVADVAAMNKEESKEYQETMKNVNIQ